jgi:signal transduction histidine kinase
LPADDAQRVLLLLEQARGGGCVNGRPADGAVSDRAVCAISGQQGELAGWLLVESNIDSSFQFGAEFSRVVTLVLSSVSLTLVTALIAIIMILPLSLGVGYLLARRLTQRLERLTAATGDVAAGDLGRRVDVESLDEVGRLSADFNSMAEQLGARERALADEAARAEALLRANRRLVANVSHELRTPLATLRGYLEALEQAHGDHLPAHDLEVIQREARRLTELIDDLFTLARAEAQQLPLTIEAVDADALAARLVDTLAPLARRERQIELVAALPADLPPVRADRTRLEQVLLNLVQNALRHTPPGGIIAIEGRADPGSATVTLTVADTGVGIPAEDLPLVFERFYRSDSSRARETGGAGLGLALVEELVTAMGGSVAATSEPGRGSRFSVALPQATKADVALVS